MFSRVEHHCSSTRFLIQNRTLSVSSPRLSPRSPNLPGSPYHWTIASYSYSTSGTALSILATRHLLKSRGRFLRLGRSNLNLTPTSTASCSRFSPLYTPPKRAFSRTSFAMTATKIDGTAIAKGIRERLHAEIEATQKVNPRYKPSLKIIQGTSSKETNRLYYADLRFAVGDRSDSSLSSC